MKRNKLNIVFSTFNFVLCFVGYQLVTTLFLPATSDWEGISRSVTIPYRVFALTVALGVIFLNLKTRIGTTHLALKVFWVYWVALIIRIFYDANCRIDLHLNDANRLWLHIFGVCLPAMYSLMKSYKMIDLDKALIWIYATTAMVLILSLFNNTSLLLASEEITQRLGGNLALGTISFGHLGATGVIMSFFILFKKTRLGYLCKLTVFSIMLLSFFLMLRAGSRSPILALVATMMFWFFARKKDITIGFFITGTVIILLMLFIDPIIDFIGDISPVMEYRLKASVHEGDSSGRDQIFKLALQSFWDQPFLGKQFAMFDNGDLRYSHNIILDSLMGLGVWGGGAMIYVLWSAVKTAYLSIKNNDEYFWVLLLLIQHIIFSMFSGAIYFNGLLNMLLVFAFLPRKDLSGLATRSSVMPPLTQRINTGTNAERSQFFHDRSRK